MERIESLEMGYRFRGARRPARLKCFRGSIIHGLEFRCLGCIYKLAGYRLAFYCNIMLRYQPLFYSGMNLSCESEAPGMHHLREQNVSAHSRATTFGHGSV